MSQLIFASSELVSDLRVGVFYNRKFESSVQPMIASTVKKPIVYGHVKRVLELQGFDTNPATDNKSMYDPDSLFVALSKYIPSPKTEIDNVSLTHAYNRAQRAFARPEGRTTLIPLTFNQVSGVVHTNTSSGAPSFQPKGEALDVDIERAKRIVAGQRAPDPCVSWHRTSHGESGPKQRLVWGYPLTMTLIEGRFAYPLYQAYLQQTKCPILFGCPKLISASRMNPITNCDYAVGFDYSKFDASVKPFLIRMAFQIIRSWFDEAWWRILDLIENYFIHTRIVMPDGYVYQKSSGIPSGSWFTQVVDSIVNYISIQYANLRVTGKAISDRRILVLGDDSLFGLNHKVNIKEYQKAAEELGLNVNLDKTAVAAFGERVHFLGHEWDKGVVHREPLDLAKRMIYPERIDYTSITALQRIGEYITDAVEVWVILWQAFCQRYGSNAIIVKPVESVIKVGSSQGLTRFILKEFGQKSACTAWAYVMTGLLH